MGAYYEQGKYRFSITNQGFGESGAKKTPYFFLQGEPVALQFDDGTEDPVLKSFQRTIKIYITENTIDRALEDLGKLGFEGKRLAQLDPSTNGFHNFAGAEIIAECSHQAGLGDKSDQLFEQWQLPFEGAGKPQESDSSVAKKLDSLFGKKVTARAKSVTKAPQPAVAGSASPEEDDIPF